MRTPNIITISRVFFILLLVVSYSLGYGQQATPVNEKYVNVDLFHGNLNLTIPLYNIKARTLSCPVSLNYSPVDISGDRAYKRFYGGANGLGWSLVAGGSITRKINGIPDESTGNANTEGTIKGNFLNNIQNFNPNTNTDYDPEEDEFSFNFGGHTGTFMYYRGKWKIFADEDFEIVKNLSVSGKLLGFTITTLDGVVYRFGGEAAIPISGYLFDNSVGFSWSDSSLPLAWYLKSISSPEGDDIEFDYINTSIYYPSTTNNTKTIERIYHDDLNSSPPHRTQVMSDFPIPNSDLPGYSCQQVILQRISSGSDNFSVYFSYVNRSEPFKLDGFDRNPLKLDNVVVSYAGNTFKKYALTYDDRVDESLKLTSVQEFAISGGSVNGSMPAFSFLYAPKNSATSPEDLTQVVYPTGGYTNFEYENTFGSIRLQSQTSYGTGSDKRIMTTYHYVSSVSGNVGVPNFTSGGYVSSGQNSIVDNIFYGFTGDGSIEGNNLINTNTYKYYISDPFDEYSYRVESEGVYKDGLPNATVQEKEIGYSSVWVAQSAIDELDALRNKSYKHFSFVNFKEVDASNHSIYHNANDVGKMTQYEELDFNGILLYRVMYEYKKIKDDGGFSCYTMHTTKFKDIQGTERIWFENFLYDLHNYKYKLSAETEERKTGFWRKIEYDYDPYTCLLRSKKITEKDNNPEDNIPSSSQTVSYKYFSDFSSPFFMINSKEAYGGGFSMPIETIYKRDGKITDVEFVSLALKQSSSNPYFLKPQTIYKLDITHPINESDYTPANNDLSIIDSKLKPRLILEYDDDGNLVGQSEPNGKKICYVGCTAASDRPLLILNGMTYSEYKLSGELPNWSPELITKKRASLPNVQITSYTYDLKLGTTTSVTSPNGLSVFYEYDSFGRLRNMKDNNRNLLRTYDYTSNIQ